MQNIFSRGLAVKSSSLSQHSSGIIVSLCCDFNGSDFDRITFSEFGQNFTAEQVCFKSAARLNIRPLTAQLFALYSPDNESYLPPNEPISCSADSIQEFVLRVRFVPPEHVIGRLASSSMHRPMFEYLFLQIRSDFMNDRIDFREKSIKQEHLLGLGVIDMVRYSKQYGTDLRRLDPQNFIPVSAKGKFKFVWDRKRLQMNFKPHLDKEYERYKNDADVNIKLTYVKSILGYAENNYGMETFVVRTACSGSCDMKIVVKPYDVAFPGISVYENESHFHTTIDDLMDISLSKNPCGVVHINRRTGMPKVIQFDDRRKALSFVSLVDGYYRLQEDYHHHLCKDIESPSLLRLRSLRCHGPVSKEWAEKRLIDRHSRDSSFNFLLRQSEKEFGEFTLVYMGAQRPMFLQIKQAEDGQYQLMDKEVSEPLFSSMTELIDYYRRGGQDGKSAISLKKCVFPASPLDNKIYLCRLENKHIDEDSRSLSQLQKTPVCLVSMVQCKEWIAHGKYTDVWNSTWQKPADETSVMEVVVKRLKINTDPRQEFFTQGVHQAVFWNHPTIVTVLAVCLAHPISLILEKAELGSLDTYLQQHRSLVKVSHLILAAEQLAQAMFYLEGCREVHGNIRSRNVLVFRHEPKERFVVKLGDNGLVHYYRNLPFQHPDNCERLPWIAPECFDKLSSTSLDSDIYSFGVCLWEIFSYGERPYESLGPDDIRLRVDRHELLNKPESCPEDMYHLMKSCWDHFPDARHRPLVIVRNIRSLLAREGEASNEYNDPQWLDKKLACVAPAVARGIGNHYSSQIHDNQWFSNVEADNEKNARRLEHALSVDANVSSNYPKLMNGMNRNPSMSPPTLDGVGDDSGTPLLPVVSSDMSTTSSDTTGMMEIENTGSTVIESQANISSVDEHSKFPSIQNRPLPQPPQVDPFGPNLHLWNLHYDTSKTLGQGHYGEVLKGSYDGQDVAIKRLKKSMTERYTTEFEKEFSIMVNLKHANIVQIIGKCHDQEDCMLLVMEFVSNGCLRDFLKRTENSQLSPRDLLRFGSETVEGMVYLSSQKIIHRDLATRNVLVTIDFHMKISDFGLSRALADNRDYYKCTDDRTDLPAPWCAPEALLYRKFSEASDVWSYGVTLWEIFSFGMAPRLGEIKDLPTLIHQGRRLPMPKNCPKPVYELVLFKCWQYYPGDRWTFKKLREAIQDLRLA